MKPSKIEPPITSWDDPRLKPHWTMEPTFLISVIYILVMVIICLIAGMAGWKLPQ
jgi:hypothetical protein